MASLTASLSGSIAFDDPETALRSLASPTIDLEPLQVVCSACRYVFWQPLGACPTCIELAR